MTTLTSKEQERRRAQIEARTKAAWTNYSDTLRDLDGKDYDEAEKTSWERLQETLEELQRERDRVERA